MTIHARLEVRNRVTDISAHDLVAFNDGGGHMLITMADVDLRIELVTRARLDPFGDPRDVGPFAPASHAPQHPVSPEAGLKAIVKTIEESDNPLAAAGEWLAKATNAITGAVR